MTMSLNDIDHLFSCCDNGLSLLDLLVDLFVCLIDSEFLYDALILIYFV